MRLAEPTWLLLLAPAALPWLRGLRRPRVGWPTLSGFAGGRGRGARGFRALGPLARGAAVACLAVAMARPQDVGGRVRVAGKGVAIMAVLDRSSSMKAADFPTGPDSPPISRLEAAKATLARFLGGRADDLVGIVAFANYPDPVAPPTLDQEFLRDAVRAIRPAGPADDGTNIGDAIAWALGMIREAPTRRKVVVLLTDGRNAPAVPRPVDPLAAAEIGRSLGVTLHTIAVGRAPEGGKGPGQATPATPATPAPVGEGAEGPDVDWLARLAEAGGGRAFVAADSDALERVFREIDALEKSPVSGTVRILYRERFAPWVAAALVLLAVDFGLSSGRFRRLP